ncbi:hypothetical protein [Flavobacterium subsaxonicum]|uniref:Uncharacterized protein n=1 Tax=Flavobacterium subsaxonicum WB 4.1-42 = DSM 21790 TaxID=1121898 RepID=A0A0A2MR27_9FLAO|nr:hypothetical protein [Flavobacterium subsaxonicum]KGO95122.1 hypothetical protein Q766_03215 [Flavobacterium subsaxonicum WB 4.1-42 = DSM 21790]
MDDYKKAILAQYESVKEGAHADLLLPATTAKLKELSLVLFDALSSDDKKIYERFFGPEALSFSSIKKFDNDKFRPLVRFLRGGVAPKSVASIELLAILVDLEPRPFQKFRKQEGLTGVGKDKTSLGIENGGVGQIQSFYRDSSRQNDVLGKEGVENEPLEKTEPDIIDISTTAPKVVHQKYFAVGRSERLQARQNLLKIAVIIVLFCTVAAFAVKDLFLDSNGCMVWNKDHYETAPCDNNVNALANNPTVPLSEDLLTYQKKIEVSDTTTFYNTDGSPRVWYGKSADKVYEYFTYPGLHPETHKTLKKITDYMIKKHIKNKR